MHKIFKLCGSPSEDYWSKLHLRHATVMKPPHPYRGCVAETFKDLPAAAVKLMEILLSVDPGGRGTAAFALDSEVIFCILENMTLLIIVRFEIKACMICLLFYKCTKWKD